LDKKQKQKKFEKKPHFSKKKEDEIYERLMQHG